MPAQVETDADVACSNCFHVQVLGFRGLGFRADALNRVLVEEFLGQTPLTGFLWRSLS